MKDIDINSLNFSDLLLEYAKELNLNEDFIIVILMINLILKRQPHSLITPELLSIKLSMHRDKIDRIITELHQRAFIEYPKEGKNIYTSLDPIILVLKEKLVTDFINNDKLEADKNKTSELENVYLHFQKAINRPLTQVELSQIFSWLQRYSERDIVDAIIETKEVKKKTVSIAGVEKILLSRAIQGDKKREGRSTLSEDSNLTMKEAAEAAKLNWID